MIPFITAEQLRERLDIGAMVESMRAAHRRPVPLMERVLMQPDGPNSYLVWHAWQPGDVVVTKMGTIFPGNAALPAPLPAEQALVMVFDGTDDSYTAAQSMAQLHDRPLHHARGTFIDDGEVWQPAPAPRFSRTPPAIQAPPGTAGSHTDEVLTELGFDVEDVAKLRASGAIA